MTVPVALLGTSIKIQTENVEAVTLPQGSGSKAVPGLSPADTVSKKEALPELKVRLPAKEWN